MGSKIEAVLAGKLSDGKRLANKTGWSLAMAEHENRPCVLKPREQDSQLRFKRQQLASADAALRLWVVRVPCGLLSLMYIAAPIVVAIDATKWQDWALVWVLVVISIPYGFDLGWIAVAGRSRLIRQLLTGISPRDQGLLDMNSKQLDGPTSTGKPANGVSVSHNQDGP